MLSSDQINKIIARKIKNVDLNRCYVVGIRGSDGKNDRGVYDDYCYVVYDWALKGSFQYNSDPSAYRHGIATLNPGVWTFVAGKHHVTEPAPRGYAAFRQSGNFTVTRDGKGQDVGDYFAINFHRGGVNGTSSLGCQTVPPARWKEFRDLVYRLIGTSEKAVMENPYGIKAPTFTYILVDASEVPAILAS